MYHRALSRGIAVVVALALVMATVPRWETHAHDVGHHDDAHAPLLLAHHNTDEVSTPDADPSSPPHAHPIASFAVALPAVALLDLASPPPQSWASPQRGRTAASPPSVPPHRPPIA